MDDQIVNMSDGIAQYRDQERFLSKLQYYMPRVDRHMKNLFDSVIEMRKQAIARHAEAFIELIEELYAKRLYVAVWKIHSYCSQPEYQDRKLEIVEEKVQKMILEWLLGIVKELKAFKLYVGKLSSSMVNVDVEEKFEETIKMKCRTLNNKGKGNGINFTILSEDRGGTCSCGIF